MAAANGTAASTTADLAAPAPEELDDPGLRGLHNLRVGAMGVALCVFDLRRQGYDASEASEGLAYDVLVDVPGRGVLRLQVKSCRRVRPDRRLHKISVTHGHRGHAQDGSQGARCSPRSYDCGSYDLLGFCALDIPAMAYMLPPARETVSLAPKAFPALGVRAGDEYSFAAALEQLSPR